MQQVWRERDRVATVHGMACRIKVQQVLHVLRPLAQRRGVARQHIEAVIQVFAEAPVVYGCRQVPVGCGDDPHVNLHLACSADRLNGPILQHAKQFDLHVQRQVPDFIKEQGPAVGHLEAPQPIADRAGEGALAVTEQFALEQVPRDGAAVDRDKRTLAPWALPM